MSLMKLKKKQRNQKTESTANQKLKYRKREKHKNNKKVARRKGYPGKANVRSKNSKPESRNKSTQTTK